MNKHYKLAIGLSLLSSILPLTGFANTLAKPVSSSLHANKKQVSESEPTDQVITNNTPYWLCNGSANPNSGEVTYMPGNRSKVANALLPGDRVELSVTGTAGWAGVNFDIRKASYKDPNPCNPNNPYYGNVNFATTTDPDTHVTTVDMNIVGPTNGDGPNAEYENIGASAQCTPYLDAPGHGCKFTKLALTPPKQYSGLTEPKPYKNNPGVLYRGANLAGAEFNTYWAPGSVPYPAEFNYYIEKGMNTFRLPIRWAYLQPRGASATNSRLNAQYWNFITNILEELTAKKAYVIVDLHDYQRYAPQGETTGVPEDAPNGGVPNGVVNTPAQLANIWATLVKYIQQDKNIDPNYLILDLSNEPAQMSTGVALKTQNAAIAAIRNEGFEGLILVEGNAFTGLWSWENPSTYNNGAKNAAANSIVMTPNLIKDPANNYAINVHQYFDADGSMSGTSDNCISNSELLDRLNTDAFMAWVHANKVKVMVTEFGVGRGTDQSEGQNCEADLETFLNWVDQNAYTEDKGGFIGWTMWSAGHGWGGYDKESGAPNYVLDISPNTNTTPVTNSPQMDTLVDGGFLS